ncbi:hypothetical protein LSH36_1191g00008 [Paralvinella palmiformis]|uniref:Uncharacterized protein n=1 Tax=Paralvinella palmiformis TaxID=53620 RepID=A0AAD9MPU6_9ANNE|nr:hypothetical protein LSH36_1191g00008 [Paralvinella palmiformis]
MSQGSNLCCVEFHSFAQQDICVVHCTSKLLSLLCRTSLLIHWDKLLLTLASCIFWVQLHPIVCSHMIVKYAEYSMCICSWL